MTDCSKTVEFLPAYGRMCEAIQPNGCDGCKLSIVNNGSSYKCGQYIWERPEEAIRIVQEWADAHPAQTWLAKLVAALPDVYVDTIINNTCPGEFFAGAPGRNHGCDSNYACGVCWNQEAK